MRVYLTNLGCKLNQAELESLARQFHAEGHEIVGTLAAADLHVVNSCTVTHIAARDSRKIARRGRRLNPDMRTVLTGCYVDSDPAEARALAGVDLIVPNADKDNLLNRIHSAFPAGRPEPEPAEGLPYAPLDFGNSRALVKIEDGCNMPCAFCVIPATRGSQRSRDAGEIVREVRDLVEAGFQEVILTGVQISAYRFEGRTLYDLTRQLLETTRVPRLRLTSIAPWQFDRRILDLVSTDRVCRHFHLSLQSGCDRTLERMRRPYTSTAFAELVELIRDAVPGVALTTDLIVGFPGETDREARSSLRFTQEIGFARVHAFPYSVREGTAAAEMPDQVPYEIKRERMAAALETARTSERRFLLQQLGTETQVLFERARDNGRLGTSDNYLRVFTETPGATGTKLERVRLETVEDLTAIGTVNPMPASCSLNAARSDGNETQPTRVREGEQTFLLPATPRNS
jgi:threonylcarbamoyladenosine tRNA methylthiotransferase MtaB